MTTPASYRVTHRQYTRLPGVSASQLRELRQSSPLGLRHYLDSPDADTASRGMLRAIHCRVLEPDRYELDFAVYEGRRSGHAWDQWRKAQIDRSILNEREEAIARDVATAVLAHPVAAPLLTSTGLSELSITWTDEETGLPCRARLDRLRRTGPTSWQVIDLKTVDSTAAHRVTALVGQQGWHVQLAHYQAAVRALCPGHDVSAALITAEESAPHDVAVWVLPLLEEQIAEGERRALLATYAECQHTGIWPGRYQTEQPLALPRYLYPDDVDGVEIVEVP